MPTDLNRSVVAVVFDRAERAALGSLRKPVQRWVDDHGGRLDAIGERLLMVPLLDLGDIAPESHAAIDLVLAKVLPLHPPFGVVLDGLGRFPHQGHAWLVHGRIDDRGGQLRRLQAALADALAAYGFALDPRPYAPHVPLGRLAEPVELGSAPLVDVRLRVREVALISRTLDGESRWERPILARLGAPTDLIFHDDPSTLTEPAAALADDPRAALDERLAVRAAEQRRAPRNTRRRRRPQEEDIDS
jgi:2'-5' RNA ligase